MERSDGRQLDECRKITIEGPDYLRHPSGSVLFCMGDTKVICSATVRESVPSFMQGRGVGWVTAQYSMIPTATHTRNEREARIGRIHGRTMEISRLIGRALRASLDMSLLGERSIILDCDVIQADGGTRTASISGAFIALKSAIQKLLMRGILFEDPIKGHVAAISVGILNDIPLLDLDYEEDSQVEVDLNCVMDESGEIIEIQATGERNTFTKAQLDKMIEFAWKGIQEIIAEQKKVLK